MRSRRKQWRGWWNSPFGPGKPTSSTT